MQRPESRLHPLFETRRGQVLLFGLMIALTLFLSLRDFYSYQFGFTPDSAEYTVLAHSLVQGPSFGLVNSPGTPEPTHFPFGYPLLLLPLVLAAPHDFLLPQWLSLVATLTGGAILFWGWNTLVPVYSNRWRVVVTAMFLLAPTTLAHTRLILSEPIFTVFVLLAVWYAERVVHAPNQTGLWVGLGIALFFTVFTRSIGLLVWGVIAVYLVAVLQRRVVRGILQAHITFGLMVAAVLGLTPVQLSDLVPTTYLMQAIQYGPINPVASPTTSSIKSQPTPAPPPPESGDETTAQAAPSIVVSTSYIEQHIHEDLRTLFLLTGGGTLEPTLARRLHLPWLVLVPGSAALALFALGNVYWLNRTRHRMMPRVSLFQVVGLAYLAATLFWRGGGERLFYPIQPQLYLSFLLGVLGVINFLITLRSRIVSVPLPFAERWNGVLIGIFIVGWIGLAIMRDLTLQSSYAIWGDLRARTDPIVQATPPDAVLLSDWPALDYLETGRHAITFPLLDSKSELEKFFQTHHITHIVFAKNETFTVSGVAPNRIRVQIAGSILTDMLAHGELARVADTSYPLQILRVIQ